MTTLISTDRVNITQKNFQQILIRGDGKDYQLRIKSNRDDYYSYIISFKTSGEWETVTIPAKEMYASCS